MSKFLKTLVVLVLGAACAQQLFAAGVNRKKVENKVSPDDPIGARSYKEVKKNTDELVYLTRPKDTKKEFLSEKPSEVNDRRDPRVVWDLKTHTQKLHDWRGQMPPGKRVWVQIIGEFILPPGVGEPPEWQSWSVDIDLDADSNNNGIIDPDPRVPDDNLAEEDRIEADRPGVVVCGVSPLILRKIKPKLPAKSRGWVFVRRSEPNKLDIRTDPSKPETSIFDNARKKDSRNLFDQVRGKDLNLWIVALKKGNLNVEAFLEAEVVFLKRTEDVKFKDTVRVYVPGLVDLDMDGVTDEEEENPGGFIPVNADNDNGSAWMAKTNKHIPTTRDFSTSPISGEDDLAGFTIRPPGNLGGGTLRLRVENNGRARIRLWDTPTKEKELSLPLVNPPSRFFVEGVLEGAKEREVKLVLELVRKGKVLCTDAVAVTVTPVLIKLEASANRIGSDLIKDPKLGWVLFAEGLVGPGFCLDGEAIIRNLKGKPKGEIQLSQTVFNKNNLRDGAGAILNDGTTRKYNWPKGGPRQDALKPNQVPFYILKPQRTGDANRQKLEDQDSPALQLKRRNVGNVMPPVGGSTRIDVSFFFTTHLGFQFDDGTAYFFGRMNWNVRFSGRISQAGIFAQPTFAPNADNRNNSSTGFTRDNANPKPVTPPRANAKGANSVRWQ